MVEVEVMVVPESMLRPRCETPNLTPSICIELVGRSSSHLWCGGQTERAGIAQFTHAQTAYFKGKNTKPEAACIHQVEGKTAGGKNTKEGWGWTKVCLKLQMKTFLACSTPQVQV